MLQVLEGNKCVFIYVMFCIFNGFIFFMYCFFSDHFERSICVGLACVFGSRVFVACIFCVGTFSGCVCGLLISYHSLRARSPLRRKTGHVRSFPRLAPLRLPPTVLAVSFRCTVARCVLADRAYGSKRPARVHAPASRPAPGGRSAPRGHFA